MAAVRLRWTAWTAWTAWTRGATWICLAALLVAGGCSDDNNKQPFADCGNGQIDGGENCDDGNTSDNDACLSTCVEARCGDVIVQQGVEQCDGNDLDRQSCASLGFTGTTLGCHEDCRFDLSGCGLAFTPTAVVPTVTPTSSPTPSPTPANDPCTNGLLEPDETCDECPVDCQVQTCSPAATMRRVQVTFAPPVGQDVSTATALITYRSNLASLPGTMADPSVRQRITGTPSNSLVTVNDRDYGVTVVVSRSAGIAAGRLAFVDFDTCSGATEPAVADFACVIDGCSGRFGPVTGCTCEINLP